MPRLVLDNLDPNVFATLQQHAAAHGRTLEDEVSRILADAAAAQSGGSGDPWADLRAASLSMRERLRGRVSGDSSDLIREDRDR